MDARPEHGSKAVSQGTGTFWPFSGAEIVNEANRPLPDKENVGPFDILTEVGTSGRLHAVPDTKHATAAIKQIALVQGDSCQRLLGRSFIECILPRTVLVGVSLLGMTRRPLHNLNLRIPTCKVCSR